MDHVYNLLTAAAKRTSGERFDDSPIDRRLLDPDNPYKGRYGDEWEKEVKQKLRTSQKIIPISDLIEYMIEQTDELMKGTQYEGKGLFYHDALNQLCCKETVEWMKTHGYYNRWIIPVLGCNDKVLGKSTYAGRPPGNSPECNPLDNSLIQDGHMAARTHTAATFHLPKNHPDKFSLSTPVSIGKAYSRLWCPDNKGGGVPSSKRIVQDVNKMIYSLKRIKDAKGNVVKGICDRDGHRQYAEYFAESRSKEDDDSDEEEMEEDVDSDLEEDDDEQF